MTGISAEMEKIARQLADQLRAEGWTKQDFARALRQLLEEDDADVKNDALASALAHRMCCATEHDPQSGKLHGCCIVCGVSWPCETAKLYLAKSEGGGL